MATVEIPDSLLDQIKTSVASSELPPSAYIEHVLSQHLAIQPVPPVDDITPRPIHQFDRSAVLDVAYEHVSVAILLTNEEHQVIDANPAAVNLLGYTLEELRTSQIEDIVVVASERDGDDSPKTDLLPTKYSPEEIRIKGRDGSLLQVERYVVEQMVPGINMHFLEDVSERRRIEQDLSNRERFIQNIADTVPYQLYVFDLLQGKNIYINRRISDFFGMQLAELQERGQSLFLEKLHPDDLSKLAEFNVQWDNANDGDVFESQYRLQNNNGEYRWLRSFETVLARDDEGHPTQILGTAHDLTEHITAQIKVNESEQRYKSLFDNTSDAILLADDQGNYVSGNAAACSLLGYTQSEIEQLTVVDITPNVTDENISEAWSAFMDAGRMSGEYLVLCKDGSTRLTEYRAVANVQPGLHMSALRDITEAKQIEQALVASEQKYRQLFNSSPVGLFQTTTDGTIIAVNKSLVDLLGYPGENELLMTNAVDHYADATELERNLALTEDADYYIHHPLMRRFDGSHFPSEIVANVHRNSQGEIQFIQGSVQDITERLATAQIAQERLNFRMQIEKEREVASVRGSMFSILAHEFKTPLTIIKSSADVLNLYWERLSDDKRNKRLESISSQVQHMSKLIDEVSIAAQADRNQLAYQPTACDVVDFCEQLVEEFAGITPTAQPLKLDIRVNTKMAVFDKSLMRHALINLISNAYKYTPDGGEVRLIVERVDTQLHFTVIDQGIGIPLKEQSRLFSEFFRASNVGDIRGTGMGLSIVKRVVELHEGSVSFESYVGKGSSFKLKIPMLDASG